MFAVIETGSKQYLVSENDKIKVEKLPQEEGAKVVFDKVLLVSDQKKATVGKPYVKGAKVEAEVIKQGRGKKIKMLKYKSKTRQRRRKGHRQEYTEVAIKKIG